MSREFKAYLALCYVSIVWGTTYLVLLIGVSQFPAFLFSALRQMLAGGLLLLFVFISSHKNKITRSYIIDQFIIGLLMITFGNGFVGYAEMYISSSLAALICATMPVWIVCINMILNRNEKPNSIVLFGLLLGIIGIGLVFKEHLIELFDSRYQMGIGLVFIAVIGWSMGTVLIKKKAPYYKNVIMNSGFQLFFGGVGIFVCSLFFDDFSRIHLVDTKGIIALLYLIFFGSIGAFVCYLYALSNLPVGIASVYSYINPAVAVVLGAIVLDEKLNVFIYLALIFIIAGVFLVNYGYRKVKKT
ncbi:MAG: EamA family transporter [Chitinophagaceae bacterium]|nr:EamA family transporter [Chitinophagaceae bacterium]